MKMIRLAIMLLAVVALALTVPAVWAKTAPGKEAKQAQPAKGTFLADMHKDKGLDCSSCHGKSTKVDDNETMVNKKCIECHGSLDKMAEKSKHEINPHKAHLGNISCTVCHHGHTTSWTYCLNCHGFDLKIPAGAVAAQLPSVKAPALTKVPKNIRTDKTDVVIIGAGATGLTAAITAHDDGAKVIVLEKMPITGGNSQLAAGGMNACETKFQKEKGIKDDCQIMYDDTMKGGKYLNEPQLVRILADRSASSVDWLTKLGADLSDIGRMGGASVNRTHRPSGGAAVGAHVTQVLKKNADDRKIDIRVNSRVVKILEDKKGRVTGVLVEGKHSKLYRIDARAVVVTAGGFSANPEKVAYYSPDYIKTAGMATSNQPGATGDGIDLGAATGGQLRDMNQIQIHPSVAAGSRILITEAVRGNGAIMVNQEGKRFVNELTTRDAASAAILSQTGKTVYLVFDEDIRKSLKQIDGYFHLELVVGGDTVKALAEKLKVPPDALETTINAYNKAVDDKNDPEFKRPDMPRPIRTPKFYAIAITPGVHYTMGGLQVSPDANVLDKEGKPIPGLFAAGEGTGGVHGANRLGGNSISQTITFGRIAGDSAVKFAKATKEVRKPTDEAKAMVEKAIAYLKENGREKTLAEINEPGGLFAKGELYVFAYDLNGTLIAHPNPAIVGKNLLSEPDSKGKLFRKEIAELAKSKGKGFVDYTYLDPVTKKEKPKTTYIEKVDNMIFCCGTYKR
jgi:fumarate reductase flavoprotein subunit